MSKQAMREEAERLMREASVAVKQGDIVNPKIVSW